MHKLLHWVACCAVAAESASPGALAAALSDMLRYTSVVAGDASSGFSYKLSGHIGLLYVLYCYYLV